MAEADSDEVLVHHAQRDPNGPAGRAAAETLFARYEERVYAWCRRMVRDHERALDVAQDAMILAWRSLPSFEGRSRFSSWLFSVTRHRCLRELERSRRWSLTDLDPEAHEDPAGDPGLTYESREEMMRVIEAVEVVLTQDERQALWLRCEQGLPVEEITKIMKLTSSSGARGLLQTVRRKLRAALAERGTEGGTT